MPMYEYACENGHQYEERRSIHEDQKTRLCPYCRALLKPRYAVPAISLIGRGFYSNGG